MRELAPDLREVLAIVNAYALAGPLPDLRAQTDETMARQIAKTGAEGVPLSFEALDRLVDPLVVLAIAACWCARDGSAAAVEARRALVDARVVGRDGLGHLRARVNELQRRMADLLVEAHTRTEMAEGVARAVGFAQRGELWSALDTYVETVMHEAVAAHRLPKLAAATLGVPIGRHRR